MKKKSYILKLLSVTLSCLLLLSFNIKTIEIFADNINTNISEDHLKNLQEAVLKSADRVIESELPENAMHNGLFVDLTYQSDKNRFLFEIVPSWNSESQRKYYLDIDTLEFYIE